MPKPADKLIIAVDIDDVIAAETEGIREFTNKKYGFNHQPEDYLVEGSFDGYWEKIWKLDQKEAREHFEKFLKSPAIAHLKVVDGAIEVLDKLKIKYDLVVVTSRFGPAIASTEPWLEAHFPTTFSNVEFVTTKDNKKVTKADICKEIGASYLIDDNPETCNIAASEGITALLFGVYGWNRNVKLQPMVIRVKNWQEVLEYFEREQS
jgi:5'(3')-deoxyribonucleotidase